MNTIHDNWPKRIQHGVVYCPYLPLYSTYVPEQFEFDFVKEITQPVEYQTLMYFDDYSYLSETCPIL